MIDSFITENPQIIEKAKQCKSKDELISLLKGYNFHFNDEIIEELYDYLNKKELGENILDSVAGGKELQQCTSQEALSKLKNGEKVYYLQDGQVYVDMSNLDLNIINVIMNSPG